MSRTIEVIVSPTGETRLQTKGYAGNDCQQASKFLEDALGTKLTESKTAEYFQSASTEQHVQQ